VGFRDDFDGDALDGERWTSFAQSGIIRLANGKLDVLNTGGQKNFPYVVTKHNVIPSEGPFFVEFSYNVVTVGQQVSFQLDYLPAEQPNEKALTSPFMTTNWFYTSMRLIFDTESAPIQFQSKGGYGDNTFHRVRIECDGQRNYRVIFDQTELGTFQSKRRPQKFWLGTNPVKDVGAGVTWPRLQVDYFEANALTTPDPALPAGAPSPAN
jgi:hypothetical protein